jgi:hypothetical protein
MQVMPEVLSDIAFDKILGNVPIVGIYFNAIVQNKWHGV